MKYLNSLFIAITLLIASCSSKKSESTSTTADSVAVADNPAPSSLAFSPLPGYTVKNIPDLPDSVNYFLLGSQQELEEKFSASKDASPPDFLINYTLAVVYQPTEFITSLQMEHVEASDTSINVYLTLKYGEKQSQRTAPTALFAIEKRDGYSRMQFYINEKKDKALDFYLP